MKVAFVRHLGLPDRVYVQRDDGTECDWSFPSYGDGLPHDLVHLVAEKHLGLSRGFWGLVAMGIDFSRVNQAASVAGGPLAEKYAALGPLDELMLAELVANLPWGQEWFDEVLETNREFQELPPRAELDAIAAKLAPLRARWAALDPKGALHLEW